MIVINRFSIYYIESSGLFLLVQKSYVVERYVDRFFD